MYAYTRQKAKSKYRNRIRLERASQKQSSDTYKTPYVPVKRCRELAHDSTMAIVMLRLRLLFSDWYATCPPSDESIVANRTREPLPGAANEQYENLPLHSDAAPFSTYFNLIGSQDLVVKSRINFSTQLALLSPIQHLIGSRDL
ncbi:hypothetical protein PR048_003972 [Dryococelus australis]|uniref:Uncharacterized protein n=1 Tax=Dryococelus australis TaxID=614101 RepID=A0ABQ9I5C0_9NEOP|nr:hypothetical protein PR048_003972 [Dryococelus australis]